MVPALASSSGSVFTLHARHEHGGYPVRVKPSPEGPRYEVEWPEGSAAYTSVRQLLRALYNNGDTSPECRDPNLTFDRYFRLHKREDTGPTVFDLFGGQSNVIRLPRLKPDPQVKRDRSTRRTRSRKQEITRPVALELFGVKPQTLPKKTQEPMAWADPPLSVAKTKKRRKRKSNPKLSVESESPKLGIDLAKRGHEVRKLLYAGFGGKMARAGYDPEDVLQEVYRGILARNNGKCPFDASKSSFGHYVHMVCGCILANYHRKQSRRADFEQVGMYTYQGGDNDEWGGLGDAAVGATTTGGHHASMFASDHDASFATGENLAMKSLTRALYMNGINRDGSMKKEAELAVKALPLVYEGHARSQIAGILGVEPNKVGRALSYLRKVSAEWKKEQGIP